MAKRRRRAHKPRANQGNNVNNDEQKKDEAERDEHGADEASAAEGSDTSAEDVSIDDMPPAPDLEQSEEDETVEGQMTLVKHLAELRSRIIKSLIAVAIGTGVAYYFIEDIMKLITLPTGKLYYLQPAEAFFTYLKIALFVGFLLALPIVFYQVWRFVLPALTVREKFIIGVLVPSSVLLFFAGLAFSFFLVLPAAIGFFVGFSTENLQPMFSLHQYFDFVLGFILPFGAVFEVPLVVLMLAKIGLVSSRFLASKQRIVIFLSFVIGAVVSPTVDIFTQSMIALPLRLLYEISYFIVKYVMKK